MIPSDVFTVDYGKRLSDIVLRINWKYLDALEKTAKDDKVERGYTSARMTEIQRLWNTEIADTCREMMVHMNRTVAEYQRIATDVLAIVSLRHIVIKDQR